MKAKIFCIVLFAALVAGVLPQPAGALLFSDPETIESLKEKIAALPEEGKLKTKAILYSDLGTLYYKRGEFEDAVAAFKEALKFRTTKKMKRHIYLYLGKSYESHMRLDRAIEAYEKAAAYDRKEWKRHRDLGQIYEKVRLYDKAAEAYQKAIRYNAKDLALHYALGRTWRHMGLYNKAEIALLRAQELGMKGKGLGMEISLVYEGQGRFSDSLLAFEKILDASSSAKEWARFIYLAVLAKNRTFANQGMDQLREKNLSEGTLAFYESLAQTIGQNFDEILSQRGSDPAIDRIARVAENGQKLMEENENKKSDIQSESTDR